MAELMGELMGMLAEYAEALGTMSELARLLQIAESGTSATRQRRVHAEAAAQGEDPGRAVVKHLIEEFHTDL